MRKSFLLSYICPIRFYTYAEIIYIHSIWIYVYRWIEIYRLTGRQTNYYRETDMKEDAYNSYKEIYTDTQRYTDTNTKNHS